jgi:hypothetical protein
MLNLPVRVAAIFFEVSGLTDDRNGQLSSSRNGDQAQDNGLPSANHSWNSIIYFN